MKKQFRVKHAPTATGGYVDPLYARRPRRKVTDAQARAARILKERANKYWEEHR